MEPDVLIACFRPAASVTERPHVTLVCWSVMRVRETVDFLFGAREGAARWRQSTPIVAFMPADRVAITASGRRYILSGPPAEETEFPEPYKVVPMLSEPAIDVTGPYWRAMLHAAQSDHPGQGDES